MGPRSLKGKVAVVGLGESKYYRYGESPDSEFVLTLKAILAACGDADIKPASIDGFVSFSDDRNTGLRLAAALGVSELRWSTMQWGGGGGGGAGAVQQAAAAIAVGAAETVVVYRGLAQGQFGRFGNNTPRVPRDSLRWSAGVTTPAAEYSLRVSRFLYESGIPRDTLRAISMATYQHAQNNPRAVMYGKPLSQEKYDASRWIVEPFKLYDCCQENDGAAALILTTGERARDLSERPGFVLSAAQGGGNRSQELFFGVYDTPKFATAEFGPLAVRLFSEAGLTPQDVDVAQVYENFTGGVLMAIIEHGFCTVDDAAEFITLKNLTAPNGRLPINTSGGNLAEAYIHGFEQHVEAVRQLRGESVNQVPDVDVSFVSAGPMVSPTSCILYGSEAVLG